MSEALCRLILAVADGQCQRLDDRLSLREVLLEFIGKNDSVEAAMLAQGQDALCVEILQHDPPAQESNQEYAGRDDDVLGLLPALT